MPRFAPVFAMLLAFVMSSAVVAQDKPAAPLPPGEKDAKAVVEKSPRHGEYVDVTVAGRDKPVRSYVVYPEVKDKAPVVIVIHEIFGLSDWIKGVTDQLAADGFIAIAPDLLSGKGSKGGGTEEFAGRDEVTKAVRSITPEEATAALNGVREYGAKLPASNGKTATIGFCWGGAQSFAYATKQPQLNAAVVYYGTSPEDGAALKKVGAPVLGLYGSDDARVNKTIEPAQAKMKELGKKYTPHIYDGAGHGFLRQQDGRDGANLKAAQQAWPETVIFLRENTK
ncbi:MAG: dienelactone hydrolase family protein [Tepidisphaeraceae bacterium]